MAHTQFQAGSALRHKISVSDIVQETLLQAHVALAQFHGNTELELKAWLRAILANKLADAARHFLRRKRDVALEQSFQERLDDSSVRLERLAANQTSPSQYVLARERAAILSEALVALPGDQAAAVSLRYLSDYSVAEVAAHLGRTQASVAGLLRRGLQDLRARLEEIPE